MSVAYPHDIGSAVPACFFALPYHRFQQRLYGSDCFPTWVNLQSTFIGVTPRDTPCAELRTAVLLLVVTLRDTTFESTVTVAGLCGNAEVAGVLRWTLPKGLKSQDDVGY